MKYLMLILSAALSTGAVAQTKKKPAAKTAEKPSPVLAEPTGVDPGTAPVSSPPPPPQIYNFVEQMPTPAVNVGEFLGANLHYPDTAEKKGIQGRVIVQFVVNEDGTMSDVKVLRGIGYGCDEEAVRVLKMLPPWKPGKQNGKLVKVFYTQPITFKLQ